MIPRPIGLQVAKKCPFPRPAKDVKRKRENDIGDTPQQPPPPKNLQSRNITRFPSNKDVVRKSSC